jgi:hypothetical protein
MRTPSNARRTTSTLPCAAVVACAALLAGCGQQKVNQCNALIQVINTGVQSLEKSPKVEGDTAGSADLKVMADTMDKVASDAAKVPLTIPELKKFSAEYQSMAKDVSKAARDMGAAADAKDQKKVAAAQAALEEAVKREDPLITSINTFCGAP